MVKKSSRNAKKLNRQLDALLKEKKKLDDIPVIIKSIDVNDNKKNKANSNTKVKGSNKINSKKDSIVVKEKVNSKKKDAIVVTERKNIPKKNNNTKKSTNNKKKDAIVVAERKNINRNTPKKVNTTLKNTTIGKKNSKSRSVNVSLKTKEKLKDNKIDSLEKNIINDDIVIDDKKIEVINDINESTLRMQELENEIYDLYDKVSQTTENKNEKKNKRKEKIKDKNKRFLFVEPSNIDESIDNFEKHGIGVLNIIALILFIVFMIMFILFIAFVIYVCTY